MQEVTKIGGKLQLRSNNIVYMKKKIKSLNNYI